MIDLGFQFLLADRLICPHKSLINLTVLNALHFVNCKQLFDRSLQCIVTAANEQNYLVRGSKILEPCMNPTDKVRFSRTACALDDHQLMLVSYLRIIKKCLENCLF